ncbi:hypothetical protein ACWIGI_40060 [Nocardia sp. NPDC055321]
MMFSNPRWAIVLITVAIATLATVPLWAAGPLWDAAGPTVVLAPTKPADFDALQPSGIATTVLRAAAPTR